MIERFTGPAGAMALKDALLQQRLVQHDDAVADRLVTAGELVEHQPGGVLIEQGHADDVIFFILAGEVEVEVNGRPVATRKTHDTVGEMSAADPTAPRSATVRAIVVTVSLKVSAVDFVSIANDHSKSWRALARLIAARLRERHRFHRPPNTRPVLFVGSSVEGLPVAKHIQLGLKHEPVEVRIWTDGVFGPSGVTVDKLLEQVAEADFAAFVFGPDDRVASRSESYEAPRDNVVLELGMFLSHLGRERTYMVMEHKADLKIPTDLLGIAPITYVSAKDTKLEVTLATVCTELAKRVREQGAM
jgi:CRP/FNR family transcriptional regulator, cyclic AMP receptor protein